MNKKNIYYNFNRKIKWLGIIDYKSLVIVIVYIFFIINIIRVFNVNFEIAIYILIISVLPIIILFTVDVNNETSIDMLITILRFKKSKKIFVNKKYISNLSKERYCKF